MNHSSKEKCCACGTSLELQEYSVWAAELIDGVEVRGRHATYAIPICSRCEVTSPEVAKHRTRSRRIAIACTAFSLLGLLLLLPLFAVVSDPANSKRTGIRRLTGLGSLYAPENHLTLLIPFYGIALGFTSINAWRHWRRMSGRTFGALAVVRTVSPFLSKSDYHVFGPGRINSQSGDRGLVDPDPAFSPYVLAFDFAMQPVPKPSALVSTTIPQDSESLRRQKKLLGIAAITLLATVVLLTVLSTIRNQRRNPQSEVEQSVQDNSSNQFKTIPK